jgi:hypothetical protein
MMNTKREYAFEKLRVWQAARGLAKGVYLATTTLPPNEDLWANQKVPSRFSLLVSTSQRLNRSTL